MEAVEHSSHSPALGQGVGYGIVLGLGGVFALGTLTLPGVHSETFTHPRQA
jgi:hypothetical protein